MARKPYPSDLTDQQWSRVEPHIPAAQAGGRPREVDVREVVNGIVYLNRSGRSWRSPPHDLPPWGTVHHYYRRFRIDGVWDKMHDELREAVRVTAGKEPTPSAAIIDGQSTKTTEKGGYMGMTRGRRSTAANGISSSTRWG